MAWPVDNFSRRLQAGEDGGWGVWPLLPPVAGCMPGAIPFPPRWQLLGGTPPTPGPQPSLTWGLCVLPLPPGASGLILGAPNPLLISFLHTESAQKLEGKRNNPRPTPKNTPTLRVEFYFMLEPEPYNLLCARNCNSSEYSEYNIKKPRPCVISLL